MRMDEDIGEKEKSLICVAIILLLSNLAPLALLDSFARTLLHAYVYSYEEG